MDGRKAWKAYLCLALGAALLGGLMAALCRRAEAATSYVVNSAADVRPGIVPVWTAKHTFNGTISIGSALTLTLLPSAGYLSTNGMGLVVGNVGTPITSESDPLSLHVSGGSNTMFQSVLANSSADNVGTSGTPFGSIYADNYFLGAVDALFTSGGDTYLGSSHSVFLSPGGGAGDRIVLSTANPVNFNGGPFATTIGAAGGAAALPATPVGYLKIQVDGTTYALPYYNP